MWFASIMITIIRLTATPATEQMPQSEKRLTTLAQEPSIVVERATSSYSFRSSELSQPTWSFSS
jgi:hypothetical protein